MAEITTDAKRVSAADSSSSTSVACPSLSMAAPCNNIENIASTHTTAIIPIKSELSGFTTIDCLPLELLAEIFLHCRSFTSTYSFPRAHNPRMASGVYRWIHITHVCRHWRAVALASLHLWSTIDVGSSAPCVREMVARAKHVLLDVRIWATVGRDALDAALGDGRLAQVRRIEVPPIGSLHGGHVVFPTTVFKRAEEGAPCMRALCVRNASTAMLHAFEACAMPNLEELEMVGVQAPRWTSPLLVSALRRLVLAPACTYNFPVNSHGQIVEPQKFANVLDTLERMPLLEYLELCHVLPQVLSRQRFSVLGTGTVTDEGVPPEDRIVSLRRLTALVVSDGTLECAQLLQHLSFPTATSLTLSCSNLGTLEVEHLYAAVTSKLSCTGLAPTLRTACFSIENESTTRLKCWTAELDASPYALLFPFQSPAVPTPQLEICLFPKTDPAVFVSLFTALPLSSLRSLVLHTNTTDILSKDGWIQCCASMHSLRALSVGRWAEGCLADVLALRIPVDSVESEPTKKMQPFWPRLEELRLHHVRLRPFCGGFQSENESEAEGEDEDDNEDEDTLIYKLRLALESRKMSNHPLSRLIIRGCYNVRVADIESLEETLGTETGTGKVIWYGQGGPPPECADHNVYEPGEDETEDDDESLSENDGESESEDEYDDTFWGGVWA